MGMGLSKKQRHIVVVLLAGTLLAVLNQTLLSPALPVIMEDLQVGPTTVQWLTSGYSLTEAVIIPLSAYLMGRFTTRKLFMGGIGIFAFGSLLAAIAPVFPVVLLGRMFQAAATGFVMPMVFTVILLIFPREKRGSAMGLVSLVIGFAPAVGPSLSGLLVDTVGWRALFVIVCSLAVAVIIVARFVLENYGDFEKTTFDKLSVVLSSLGLLSLLYGLSSITSSDNAAVQGVLIVVGIVLMVLFVRRQMKLPVPLLRVSVLKTRNYAVTVSIVACFQASLVGLGVLMPIYLQTILGVSALQTGMIMLPGAVIGALTALMAGRLFDKLGVRKLALPGTFVALIGAIGLTQLTETSPVLFVTLVYTCIALGVESTMTPINTWGINSLDNRMIQHANATANTINQIGASLGTAILVSLSATSAFLFPQLSGTASLMAGDRIAFIFTCCMLACIFIAELILVRDRKSEPSEGADYDMETMPAPVHAGDIVTVGMVMNETPYCVLATSSVRDVALILSSYKTSGIPVVDENDRVVGFVSDGDIMNYIGRSDGTVLDSTGLLYQASDDEGFITRIAKLMDTNVMDIATSKVISVNASTPLEDACRLFVDRHIKKVPVVNGGKLVGSLSRSDIIRSTIANLALIEHLAASADEKAETV